MKIDQLIVQYLYTNKKVTLQDIGIFHLSPNVSFPIEQEKDTAMPENAISFEYNPKALQDDGLIGFIVQQTRKIKPLATSDLESFTILGRQFMNIGKPLVMEGLGVLQKNQSGEYEFIQGHSINPKLDALPTQLREKDKEEIVFTTPARKQGTNSAGFAVILLVLILASAAAVYFIIKYNSDKKASQLVLQKPEPAKIINSDTALLNILKKDSVVIAPVAFKPEGSGFKVVIREYTTQGTSDNVFKKFSTYGHKLVQYTPDSIVFKLAMPFSNPLADTTRIKDSIQRLFGGKTYVEIN